MSYARSFTVTVTVSGNTGTGNFTFPNVSGIRVRTIAIDAPAAAAYDWLLKDSDDYAMTGATSTYQTPSNNVGNIVIESTNSTIMAGIAAGIGQSETSHYTVPAGFNCYGQHGNIVINPQKPMDVYFWMRKADDFSPPLTSGAKRLVFAANQISYGAEVVFGSYVKFEEKTDIWASAAAGAGGGSVSVDYDLLCIENGN